MNRAFRLIFGVGGLFGLESPGWGAAPAVSPPAETSQEVAAEIRAGLPAFGETKPAPAPAAETNEPPTAVHIHRLPADRNRSRPPHGEEVLTEKGKAEAAMNQYLGRADEFDRGVLNRFTLPGLWRKIPLLKYLPCPLPGMTNEFRAMEIKRDFDFHQALHDEAEFGSLIEAEDKAAVGKPESAQLEADPKP